jgi:hypothetical protein
MHALGNRGLRCVQTSSRLRKTARLNNPKERFPLFECHHYDFFLEK